MFIKNIYRSYFNLNIINNGDILIKPSLFQEISLYFRALTIINYNFDKKASAKRPKFLVLFYNYALVSFLPQFFLTLFSLNIIFFGRMYLGLILGWLFAICVQIEYISYRTRLFVSEDSSYVDDFFEELKKLHKKEGFLYFKGSSISQGDTPLGSSPNTGGRHFQI